MGVREKNPVRGKTVKVRSQGLGMTSHAANPIVEIVDGDKENIWFFLTESEWTGEEPEHHPACKLPRCHYVSISNQND